MTVNVNFTCDSCHAESKGRTWLKRRFVALNGTSDGYFGQYEYDTPQDVAPEGWIAFDRYTGCCYCPDCWDEIIGEEEL